MYCYILNLWFRYWLWYWPKVSCRNENESTITFELKLNAAIRQEIAINGLPGFRILTQLLGTVLLSSSGEEMKINEQSLLSLKSMQVLGRELSHMARPDLGS